MTAVAPVRFENGRVELDAGFTVRRQVIGERAREQDTDVATTERARSNVWVRVRNRWNKQGLQEVDVDHPRYEMLNAIKLGIHSVVKGEGAAFTPKEELNPSDYKHVLRTSVISGNNKTFEFTSYASSVFATLRNAVGISEESYVNSLAPPSLLWLEFFSNSRGGQDFFLTNDKRYFLKTEKEYYVNVLLKLLSEYLQHFLSYPHSLLVKFVGLYAVKVQGKKTLYFYVMQNIFFPDERIEDRFDIKGCLSGRYQKVLPDSSKKLVVKDVNFDKDVLDLGEQRDWFLKQIEYDLTLLRSWGVQDYSLLIGRQRLHSDEKKEDFADVVTRLKKSISPLDDLRSIASSSHGADSAKASPSTSVHQKLYSPMHTSAEDGREDSASHHSLESNCESPERPKLTRRPISLIHTDHLGKLLTTGHRRLLPKSKNPLHIINGPEYRYYFGIIDFLTKYECRQRIVRCYKNIRYCCGDHSTVPPDIYAIRLKQYIQDHMK